MSISRATSRKRSRWNRRRSSARHDRDDDASDDFPRIEPWVEVCRALGGVADADRRVDDRDVGARGADQDLGFERPALVAGAETERAVDRVTTHAALRVAELPARDGEIGRAS